MTELEYALKELAAKMAAPRPTHKPDPKQARTGGIYSYPPTVTPYLPAEATAAVKAHERGGHPAFVKAYEQARNQLVCPNCQGVGFVMITLTEAGPYSSPSSSGVITWFDGNEQWGKGWYRVGKTLTYDCPKCKGLERG